MASTNKVILIGNLGRNPEVRYNPSGFSVATMSLATTHAWKDRQSGVRRDETEWHRLVAFGQLTDVVGRYLKKGSQVYVEGRLKTRKWQDKSGKDQYTTEVVVEHLQMLGKKNVPSQGGKSDSVSKDETAQDHEEENVNEEDELPAF